MRIAVLIYGQSRFFEETAESFNKEFRTYFDHDVDIHKLSPEIPLILGGINIPSQLGCEGHSDGDVVIHSLVDAILGSLALGDIGTYFPSNNEKFKNANSEIFLDFALKKIKEKKYSINNIDINIILESPKINQHIDTMKNNLSKILYINSNDISIKATTTDKLGFIGDQKGIMSTTTILVKKDES